MSVGTSVPRTRARHLGPERRRPQVLDAALSIAVEHGVAAVTIGAIATQLGVTRPVVYACFADRVELLTALLERERQHLLTGTLAALPHDRADATEAVFVRGFQDLLATVANAPASWRLVFDADPDPAVVDAFQQGREMIARHVTRLLRPTLRAWGTHDADRKLPVLVEQFMSASEGAVRSLLHESNSWNTTSLGEFIGKAVYRAFKDA